MLLETIENIEIEHIWLKPLKKWFDHISLGIEALRNSTAQLSGTLWRSSQEMSGKLSGGTFRCSRDELSGRALRHSQEEFPGALSNVADDRHVAKPPTIRACTLPHSKSSEFQSWKEGPAAEA